MRSQVHCLQRTKCIKGRKKKIVTRNAFTCVDVNWARKKSSITTFRRFYTNSSRSIWFFFSLPSFAIFTFFALVVVVISVYIFFSILVQRLPVGDDGGVYVGSGCCFIFILDSVLFFFFFSFNALDLKESGTKAFDAHIQFYIAFSFLSFLFLYIFFALIR